MLFVPCDDMVDALATDCPDQPLGKTVLPRRAEDMTAGRGCGDLGGGGGHLFEALVLMLAQQMTFAAVARIVGETWHRVHAICSRYVDLALTHADLSAVDTVAIDETSYKRGHNYLTLAADADARKVVFVTDGRDADTIASFAAHLRAHKADPENITCVSIDMSPAFIKGVTDHLSNARITFDKFHVIAHASQSVDKMRRVEQRTDPALKGLRWALLKDRSNQGQPGLADPLRRASDWRPANHPVDCHSNGCECNRR